MLPILYDSPSFRIETYPFFLGIAWGMVFFLGQKWLMTTKWGEQGFRTFFIINGLTAWVGAKLFFLLTLPFEISSQLIHDGYFWIGGGGVFYGGMLFFFLGTLLLIEEAKIFSWEQLSIIIPLLPFGHAVGRIGCFFAGCCYGKYDGSFRHPVQLYEAICLVIISLLLRKMQKNFSYKMVLICYPLFYASVRFFLEFWRGDVERGVWRGGSFAQMISITIILIIVVYLMINNKGKR